jgi:hypothetical protein
VQSKLNICTKLFQKSSLRGKQWLHEKHFMAAAISTYNRFLPVAGCGHSTRRKGRVTAFGETTVLETPLDAKGKPYICLECLGEMSIKCAYCHGTIFPFDSITLYSPGTLYKPEEGSITFGKNPVRFVGCLRPACVSEKRGFFSAVWLPNVVTCHAWIGEYSDDPQIFLDAVESSRYFKS